MNNKVKVVFKNTIYTFLSNFISFVINALVVLLIPKLIGVAEYGYFQLYLLLCTYALSFHLGWNDGIYLRYVGMDYDELDKKNLSAQFRGVCVLAVIWFIVLLGLIQIFVSDVDKKCVYSMASLVVLIVTPRIFTSVVMQMVNYMKKYSLIILAEKCVYAIILIIMLIFGVRDFKILIISDIIGKIASLILGVYFCRDIILQKPSKNKYLQYCVDAIKNIKIGFFLLISNFASMLITGIIQFAIENRWSMETFSKVSLTFNMSKMLLVVITALSVVLVPMLKHLSDDVLAKSYNRIRAMLLFVLCGMLVFYYPMKVVLSIWLPQYKESLVYMALLFPMCLFESKTSLLVNTYMKAMREEKRLCLYNVITVVVSAIVAIVTIFIFSNLFASIVAIPYLLAFRCLILEFYLQKKLNINLMKDAVIEIIIATLFIIFSWNIQSWLSVVLYLIIYLAYVIYIKDELKNAFKVLRK